MVRGANGNQNQKSLKGTTKSGDGRRNTGPCNQCKGRGGGGDEGEVRGGSPRRTESGVDALIGREYNEGIQEGRKKIGDPRCAQFEVKCNG